MKKTISFLWCLLMCMNILPTHAQTDVTNTFLNNAGFDSSFDYNLTATGQLTSGTIQNVPDWLHSTPGNSLSATFAYGTASTFNGNLYSIPASGYKNQSGGCLVLNAGWSGELVYRRAVTLPAGRYKIVYAVNNRNGNGFSANRFGFVPTGGTPVYSSKTLFALNQWVTDTITIDVASTTTGNISLGYVADNTYSYNNAALCVDFMNVYYYDATAALKMDFIQQKTLAQKNIARTDRPGFFNLTALNAALANAADINLDTVDITTLQGAYAMLKNANDESFAIIAAYAPLKRAIADAYVYANNSNNLGKADYLSVIAAAKIVYDSSTDQRNNIGTTCVSLGDALTAYQSTRQSEWYNIKNGALWKDNRGYSVQAHGAGFLQVGERWYMIGEDRANTWNPDVNMYSTSDFINWRFERKIIANGITHPELGKSRFIERPKLMYCKKTGKYVVWCHWEQSNYGASEAAVFYCDSVNGPYKFHWAGRPLGIKSRDCNVFVDNDGTAYFISTTNENTDLGLFRLSDDYLSAVSHTALFTGQRREAPAIVRIGDIYYMISSACSGWDPNQAKISYSASLTSGWSSLANIGNNLAYDTQAASILSVQGRESTTYLYVGDRWQDPNLPASKTIVFPIQFSGNSCTFNYKQQLDVNPATGKWREASTSSRVSKNDWKIRSFSSQETSGENGAATNAIDGNINTKWHTQYSGTAATAPHSIEVDMGTAHPVSGFLCTPRMDNSSNGLIREFMFYVSVDGSNWDLVAGGSWLPYCSEVYFQPVNARYFRLVALSGAFATIAELDILASTNSYAQQNIAPYYKIGAGSWLQSDKITVATGNDITFGPNTSTGTGTWAIGGPNNRTACTREYTVAGVLQQDAGIYTSILLNEYNQTSRRSYTVSVNQPTAMNGVGLNHSIVNVRYYNLQGVELLAVPKDGTYIVESFFNDGKREFEKVMVRSSF